MFYLIIILIIILSGILVLLILGQNSKGGASQMFGGSSANQIFGVKKTGDFLEQATWFCAISIIVLTIATRFFLDTSKKEEGVLSPNIQKAQETTIPNQQPPQ
ncbi:MAG: preprotein translocase subunit SecG [Chitinophagaceae bacterium]|nr:preprotein translocase subunit SecG [Chitinophagaceae bacterium]